MGCGGGKVHIKISDQGRSSNLQNYKTNKPFDKLTRKTQIYQFGALILGPCTLCESELRALLTPFPKPKLSILGWLGFGDKEFRYVLS